MKTKLSKYKRVSEHPISFQEHTLFDLEETKTAHRYYGYRTIHGFLWHTRHEHYFE